MKKYFLPVMALSAITIATSVVIVSAIAATPGLDRIGLPGPPIIPPGQLQRIELPPPRSPVPVGLAPNLLAPDAILFLAPDGLREPPGPGRPVLLPNPAEVF